MAIAQRLVSVFLVVVALAVAINWLASPIIDNSSGDYNIWGVLNWFMAAATAIVLAVNVMRKVKLPSNGSITREYLEVNVSFYASLLLALWYYWNWFNALFPENEPGVVGTIHLAYWGLIDPLLVLVVGATGFHVWRHARTGSK